ncbi:MAG: FAD-dependent oxidoreductase [Defluviitaleaceae bacterium]|nr:FAD-dependent oxidoreductase [Defluviitaleaceae bacterium]
MSTKKKVLAVLLALTLVLPGVSNIFERQVIAQTATYQADIVVVGGGLTGLTAALQAAQNGATNVVIVEQLPILGGVGLQASGGINAAESRYQIEMGIGPTRAENFEMTRGTGIIEDISLLHTLIDNAAYAVHWLNDSFDAGFVATTMTQERAHRPASMGLEFDMANPGVGYYLMNALLRGLVEYDIPVIFNTLITEVLVNNNGDVVGVAGVRTDGTTVTIEASAVILATGAYASMSGNSPIAEGPFVEALTGAELNNIRIEHMNYRRVGAGVADLPQFRGSALQLASNVGGDTAGFQNLVIRHLAVLPLEPGPTTPHNFPGGLIHNGAIIVNNAGERFANETAGVRSLAYDLLNQPGATFIVFDDSARNAVPDVEVLIEEGLIHIAANVAQLAGLMGVEAQPLTATFEAAGISGSSFYAGIVNGVVAGGTVGSGGVKINTNAEVINTAGNVIAGLYAAGPAAGGVFGGAAGGGNTLPEVFVFGRIAGASAAAFVDNTPATIASNHITQPPATPQVSADFPNGTHTGVGLGFGGVTELSVTVANGQITEIEVLETDDTITYFNFAAYGTIDRVGVITQIIRNQSTDVDVISGSTQSSLAIMRAVEDAVGGGGIAVAPEEAEGEEEPQEAIESADGVFTGSARGYSPYYDGTPETISTVVVEVTVVDGLITEIEVISHGDSTAFMMMASLQVIPSIIDTQNPNVDVMSGATGSSLGIIQAVIDALETAP